MKSATAYHGGDLQEAEALFGRPQAGWLDLSTGINPDPYPLKDLSAGAWQRLPQASELNALLSAARRSYGIAECVDIAAAPGSQSLLQHLPALFPKRTVAVLGPTYGEHAKLWTEFGHEVATIADITEAAGADIVVLVNPNNPDGRTVDPQEILALARSLPQPNGLLIVDEAFADLDPTSAILPHLRNEPVLSIRSFGKFFGLPGLRLGFAAGAPDIVDNLRGRLGPWAVSGPALEIGARALADNAWIERTCGQLADRADALDEILTQAGLKIVGGTALFRLVQTDEAPAVFERLGRAGIFVRRFPNHPDWLRFGLPGDTAASGRLASALG